MSDQTEMVKLLLDIGGAQAATDLKQKLDQVKIALDQVAASHKAGTIATDDYLREGQKLLAQQEQLSQQLGGKSVSGMKDFGRAALQTSYAVEDLQYGFSAILNNIPQIVMSLSGPPGLAAAISLVGVAAVTIGPKIKSMLEGLNGNVVKAFGTSIVDLKSHLEELEKNPTKLKVDFEQIDGATKKLKALEDGLAAFNAISATTKDQGKSKAMLSEGIAESGDATRSGKDRVVDAMMGIEKKEGTFFSKDRAGMEARDKLKEIEDNKHVIADSQRYLDKNSSDPIAISLFRAAEARGEALKAELPAIMKAAEDAGRERISTNVGQAESGKDEPARKNLERTFMGNQGAFKAAGVGNSFGASLVLSSPENIKGEDAEARFLNNEKERKDKAKKENAELDKSEEDAQTKGITDMRESRLKRNQRIHKAIADVSKEIRELDDAFQSQEVRMDAVAYEQKLSAILNKPKTTLEAKFGRDLLPHEQKQLDEALSPQMRQKNQQADVRRKKDDSILFGKNAGGLASKDGGIEEGQSFFGSSDVREASYENTLIGIDQGGGNARTRRQLKAQADKELIKQSKEEMISRGIEPGAAEAESKKAPAKYEAQLKQQITKASKVMPGLSYTEILDQLLTLNNDILTSQANGLNATMSQGQMVARQQGLQNVIGSRYANLVNIQSGNGGIDYSNLSSGSR